MADIVADQEIHGAGPQTDVRRRSVRGGAATVLAQGCRFFLTMGSVTILARLLTPTDFGLLAMAFAIISFGEMLGQLGLTMATIQKPSITHQQVNALFWLNIALGAAAWVLLQLLAPAIGWFYGDPRLVGISRVLSSTLLLGSLAAQHRALLGREMRFSALAANDTLALSIGIAIGIVMAWRGMGYWSLVMMYLARDAMATAGLWWLSGWRPGWPARCSDLRSLVRFGTNITAAQALHNLARQCDSLLLGWCWGPYVLGIYSKAYQLAMLPNQLLDIPLTRVVIPALSRMQSDHSRYRSYYRAAVTLLAALEMPIVAFVFVNADQVIRVVLGSQWVSATLTCRILALAMFVWPVSTVMDWTFVSLGRVHRLLRWELVSSGSMILGFLAAVHWGAEGMAATFVVVYYGLRISYPSLRYCFRDTPVAVKDAIGAVSRPAAAATGAAVLLYAIHWLPAIHSQGAWGLLAEFALYGVLYILVWLVLPDGRTTMGKAIRELRAAVSTSRPDAAPSDTAAAEPDHAAPRSESQPSGGPSPGECKPSQRITVVLRYDDYSAASRTDIEQQIVAMLRRNRLCSTFAVVPATVAGSQHDQREQQHLPLPEEKAALLDEAIRDGTVEIAMHGYCHQTRRGKRQGGYTEFAGASASEQWGKILAGKELLVRSFASPIRTFVPPWNSYDVSTLHVLQQAGFDTISADPAGPLDGNRQAKSVPMACTLAQLRTAIQQARNSPDPAPMVGAVFHEFDFREVTPHGQWDLEAFDQLLGWIARQPDLQVRTVGQVADSANVPDLRRLRAMRIMSRLSDFAPYTGPGPRVCWSSSRILWRSLLLVCVYAAIFYAAVGIAAIGLGRAVRLLLSWQGVSAMHLLVGGMGLALVLLGAAAWLRNADRRIKLCVLVSLVLGMCVGLLW